MHISLLLNYRGYFVTWWREGRIKHCISLK
jgi:hypothetical protein